MVALAALNPDSRPRERLASCGANHLSDDELLAIVLGAGRPGRSALELASGMLAEAGGLAGLAQATARELCAHAGIGPARASMVQAALELGRRSVGERPKRGRRLSAASDVWNYFRARLALATVEEFWALSLDVRHRVQNETCLSRG